jgi:predicted deacetylase
MVVVFSASSFVLQKTNGTVLLFLFPLLKISQNTEKVLFGARFRLINIRHYPIHELKNSFQLQVGHSPGLEQKLVWIMNGGSLLCL